MRLTARILTMLACMALMAGLAPTALADVLTPCTTVCYVDAVNGDDTFGGDTWATAKKTIQAGVTAVSPTGTVHVAAGTYSGTGNTSIQITKSLTIVGDPGTPGVAGPGPNAPVIDGLGAVKDAFDLANGVSDVTITGFEIKNLGVSDWTNGTGVGVQAYVTSTHNVTVSHNLFKSVGYGVLVGNDSPNPSSKYFLGTHTNWTVTENIAQGLYSVGFELTDTSSSSISNNVIHLGPVLDPYNYGPIGVFSWAHISQSDLTVSGNTIDGTQQAFPAVYVYAYDDVAPSPNLDGVFIHHNLITTTGGTRQQVEVRDIGTGTITDVHVTRNSLLSLRNRTAVTVDGTCNWWGQASGPSGLQVVGPGSTTTTPWLLTSDLDGDCVEPLTSFRAVRRSANITAGLDVCGTGHQAINLKGSAGAAGDTWITVYDTTPADDIAQDIVANPALTADVLIKPFNNKKGAGLLSNFNEGIGQKGLALLIYNNGNTDVLTLGTVSKANGTFTALKSVSLSSKIGECKWYQLTFDVNVTGGTVSVTGTVQQHATTSDPDSAVTTTLATLTYTGALPAGVNATGEVGVVGHAISAVLDSSVTNIGKILP